MITELFNITLPAFGEVNPPPESVSILSKLFEHIVGDTKNFFFNSFLTLRLCVDP